MIEENIYWFFSAAAQSIAAFVAFLLTGYALVYTIMQSMLEKDDSLEEIHSSLKKIYHKRLTYLSIITGSAIILSLLMVLINPYDFKGKWLLMFFTSMLDAWAIIAGIAFVISIVNPARYEKAALTVLEESKDELSLTGKMTASHAFFDEFLRLESIIREDLRKIDLYVPSKGTPRMSFSFRQMVDALLNNEIIDRIVHGELMQINKYRNLIFHGHVKKADEHMIKKTKNAINKVQNILIKKKLNNLNKRIKQKYHKN